METNSVAEIIQNNVLQHGLIVQDDLIPIPPVVRADIDDGHEDTGPFVLIGYHGEEPVYRTTHTVAHYMEGNKPGELCIHWPPLFPNIWIPECDFMQLDVTVRKEVGPQIPTVEKDEDNLTEQYEEASISDNSSACDNDENEFGYDNQYQNENDFDYNDNQYQNEFCYNGNENGFSYNENENIDHFNDEWIIITNTKDSLMDVDVDVDSHGDNIESIVID